jgi:hypothetical protein
VRTLLRIALIQLLWVPPAGAQSTDAESRAFGADVAVAGGYLSRGILQAVGSSAHGSVWVARGPFTINSEVVTAAEPTGLSIIEHDFGVEYGHTFGRWSVATGWGAAYVPDEAERVTHEVSTALAFQSFLQPELLAAYDFGAISGGYFSVAVSPSVALNRRVTLAPRAELGYNHHQYIAASRLSHVELTCALEWRTGSRLLVRPFLTRVQSFYQRELPHQTVIGLELSSR